MAIVTLLLSEVFLELIIYIIFFQLKQFQKINKSTKPNDSNIDSVGIAKKDNKTINRSVIETEKPVTPDFKQIKTNADYNMEKHKMDAGKNSKHVTEEITKDFMADQNHSHSVAVYEEYVNRYYLYCNCCPICDLCIILECSIIDSRTEFSLFNF